MDNSNQAAFGRMLREQKSTIYTVCYMFSDNKEDVEDLFQEVCIHLWQGFDSFRGESKVSSWVWKVALNTCITYQKREEKEHHESLEMDVDMFDDSADNIRQIRMLYDRIHRLGVFDRAIMLLWLDNLSYEEIGQTMGLTAKNVSVRLVRIREQLKQMTDN